ncbi:MAG TPA: GYF domain-containing protein [Rhizomicrobium sp.]|jgi:hypothetical protein|nr:GYF domain-containing protein [Rhizomicrobium sp.]
MSSTWIMSVEGQTYGPYTLDQMRVFAGEGRLAAGSLVAPDRDSPFVPASQDSLLAPLFRPASPTGSGAEPDPSRDFGARSFGQNDTTAEEESAHFLIVADMKSGSMTVLEEQIFNMGPAYQVMPQAWVLSTTVPIGAIKNILIQKLGKLDNLLVVDATHDKAAWSNLGPEADTRLRRIWTKAPNLSAA